MRAAENVKNLFFEFFYIVKNKLGVKPLNLSAFFAKYFQPFQSILSYKQCIPSKLRRVPSFEAILPEAVPKTRSP